MLDQEWTYGASAMYHCLSSALMGQDCDISVCGVADVLVCACVCAVAFAISGKNPMCQTLLTFEFGFDFLLSVKALISGFTC